MISVAHRLALRALDMEVSRSVLGRTNLGNWVTFQILHFQCKLISNFRKKLNHIPNFWVPNLVVEMGLRAYLTLLGTKNETRLRVLPPFVLVRWCYRTTYLLFIIANIRHSMAQVYCLLIDEEFKKNHFILKNESIASVFTFGCFL